MVLSALNLAIQADWHAESDYAGPALAMTTAPVRLLSVRPSVTFPVLFSRCEGGPLVRPVRCGWLLLRVRLAAWRRSG
jgi:hypothetical protein